MKQKTKYATVFSGVLVLLVGGWFLWKEYRQPAKFKLGENLWQMEIVTKQKDMEKGLSGRQDLCQQCGMLFVFPTAQRQAFWMKGMLFPLDIIWLKEQKIVYIEKNIQPDSSQIFKPEVEADQVLEINAGLSDKLGLKIGDAGKF